MGSVLRPTISRSRLLLALWALFLIPVFVLASVPTSTASQTFFGLTALVAVILLKPLARSLVPRVLLLAISSLVVIRYWLWRVSETLPPPGLDLSFTLALVLLAVETYSILVFFLNCFISADPTDRKLPKTVPPEDLPTVDILVPTYNEPTEMLSVTLAAAKNIIYPADKLTVVLCDDGGTDQRCNSPDPERAASSRARRAELQELCRELGVVYSTRERNEHAKAGNMSAALAWLTGELVVVFDADHIPSRDFLARTVGYFRENESLFLVQTPHFFINKDPIQRNLRLTDRCPSENEMFYAQIHRGLDRWGGAFFCGSAAVIRRTALDSVGGFAGETITEDAETALEIHASGWQSLYLNRAMIAGLQPETFTSFIQQRGRWATGMMQMLLLKNPVFRRGLKLKQRLCYINSMSFWLFPIIRLTFLVMPLTYLFFGIEIFVSTYREVLAYMLTYLGVSFLVQNALYSHVRWPLISEIYEIAQAPYLAKAVIDTVRRPRAAKFNVTAKDEVLDTNLISPIHGPLTMLVLLMLAGVVAAAARWVLFPGDHQVLIVVGGWALFNLIITSVAWQAVAEKQQLRFTPRVSIDVPATLFGDDEAQAVAGRIVDASTGGARLVVPNTPAPAGKGPVRSQFEDNSEIFIRPSFPDQPHLERTVKGYIRSSHISPEGTVFGITFDTEQPFSVRETVAFLTFGDSEQWRRIRAYANRPFGFLPGVAYVLFLFVRGTIPTILEFMRHPPEREDHDEQVEVESKPAHILAFGVDLDADRRKRADRAAPDPVVGDARALQAEVRSLRGGA